jgi:hypothetical protein
MGIGVAPIGRDVSKTPSAENVRLSWTPSVFPHVLHGGSTRGVPHGRSGFYRAIGNPESIRAKRVRHSCVRVHAGSHPSTRAGLFRCLGLASLCKPRQATIGIRVFACTQPTSLADELLRPCTPSGGIDHFGRVLHSPKPRSSRLGEQVEGLPLLRIRDNVIIRNRDRAEGCGNSFLGCLATGSPKGLRYRNRQP